MIQDLYLENFLFIRKTELEFSNGLNVITGETGAGKSVLLEAVKLLLGKKARSGVVLPGYSTAKIQASFSVRELPDLKKLLEQAGFANEDNEDFLTISRTFKKDGPGKVLVNGILTTAGFLKQIGPSLMEIHGQNDHQTLLRPEIQKKLLDRTGGEDHSVNLKELENIYFKRRDAQKRYTELEQKAKSSETRIQELQEKVQELSSLGLVDELEEENLKDELKRLSHAEQIMTSLQSARDAIIGNEDSNGASSLLHQASDLLKKITKFDSRIDHTAEKIEAIYFELEAIETDLYNLAEETELDPDKLYQIQARLSDFSRACRKYGTDFKGLFAELKEANSELDTLFSPDSSKEKLMKILNEINSKFMALAKKVTKNRNQLAKELEKKVSLEMSSLGFPAANFEIQLLPCEPTASGSEEIDFFVSLNPGVPGGPLKKIASGGELSRVALALKKVLAKSDELPTLLFDEIDTGIGGQTAEAVAASLNSLGKEKQVLLVTHLHQIAKEGNCHFTVTKNIKDDTTQVSIQKVSGQCRVNEIARMLGHTDAQGLDFAKNLLAKSSEKEV